MVGGGGQRPSTTWRGMMKRTVNVEKGGEGAHDQRRFDEGKSARSDASIHLH